MASVIDSHSHFYPHPTPISTNDLPSSSKPHYNYAYATPASTPTKPYPSYYYHYRPASPSARSIRRSFVSVPNLCAASSSSPMPHAARPSLLSVPPSSYFPDKNSASHSRPTTPNAQHTFKREDGQFSSPRPQKHQKDTDAQARHARLVAERAATLKRMEERQFKAQSQSWYDESQRMAAEAALRQEEYQRADEKLRRIAQERAEEQYKMHTQKQGREQGQNRSQTYYPAADATDKERYCNRRRGSCPKSERGFEQEQRSEREQAKGRTREGGEVREQVNKDQTRRFKSPSSMAAAWAEYEEACAELMRAKPPKGKASGRVTFYDIPWPILGKANTFHDLTNENISAFLLSPHHSQDKSPKSRLRAAILIWHPDKFAQKAFPHIAVSHRPAVSAGVDIVARIVTELISSQNN